MRKLAKLAVFFSLGFIILFIILTGMRFLAIRVESIRVLSQQPRAVLTILIAAARWALSAALYAGILLGLSFIAREKIFTPAAVLCVIILAAGFALGINYGLKSWENVPSAVTTARSYGGPGLILANSERPSATVLVLLKGPAEPDGARVVAVPGRPLLYQGEFSGRDPAALPPAPFVDNSPWFQRSIAIDIRLNAEYLQRRFNEGPLPFLIYAGALIFLLCSLVFILKLSNWPLANLFLGCLAFRGVLALETFFNSPEIQDVFDSVLQNRLPLSLAVPMIFCGIGLLAHLYSFLVYAAKRQGDYAE